MFVSSDILAKMLPLSFLGTIDHSSTMTVPVQSLEQLQSNWRQDKPETGDKEGSLDSAGEKLR